MLLLQCTTRLLWLPLAATAFHVSYYSSTTTTNTGRRPSSALGISSWGTKGPPARRGTEPLNPEANIQDYLKEPEAVEARTTVDQNILVSGVANTERTDQFLFDLLNHEDSAFEFKSIIAFVDDTKFSKKRLLSRSARYTGLLDKLEFKEGETSFPTSADLDGVQSWLAVLEGDSTLIDDCQTVVDIAKSSESLTNIAILLTGANQLDATACQGIVDDLKASGKVYTIVAVGALHDGPEGKDYYHYGQFGDAEAVLPEKAVFSREEAYRMVSELLQLECGANQALTFAEIYNVNATEAKLIKGLREAGYARPQEINHMIRDGPEAYAEAIETFRTQNPDWEKGYTTNAWWEADEYKQSRERSDQREQAKLQLEKDARTLDIEDIATEWAKREYFRESMAGSVDMSEEEYIKANWDTAMKEGEVAYKIQKGELTDAEAAAELETFQSIQERKQAAMLKRAKEEMKALLEEDSFDDDDDDDDDE